jgi:hypothetical protein
VISQNYQLLSPNCDEERECLRRGRRFKKRQSIQRSRTPSIETREAVTQAKYFLMQSKNFLLYRDSHI